MCKEKIYNIDSIMKLPRREGEEEEEEEDTVLQSARVVLSFVILIGVLVLACVCVYTANNSNSDIQATEQMLLLPAMLAETNIILGATYGSQQAIPSALASMILQAKNSLLGNASKFPIIITSNNLMLVWLKDGISPGAPVLKNQANQPVSLDNCTAQTIAASCAQPGRVCLVTIPSSNPCAIYTQ